jgi:chloramphenicol 3-O-phosphotransferase
VTTRIIVGLSGGKIDGKDVNVEHVVVKVREVFMHVAMEPFCEVVNPCQVDLKEVLVGVVVFWSSEF